MKRLPLPTPQPARRADLAEWAVSRQPFGLPTTEAPAKKPRKKAEKPAADGQAKAKKKPGK